MELHAECINHICKINIINDCIYTRSIRDRDEAVLAS